MCGGGQKTKTNQTSTTTPSNIASGLYNDVIQGSQAAANNFAYDPATGKSIADLTPQQIAAMQGVTNAQGTGQAATDAAGNLITQGASAISADEIANYTNPHQQAVIDAAMAQARQNNAVAQSSVAGNAASMQALGGNRVGVAQGVLAGEQGRNDNSLVANLMSQGYDRATALAQADKLRQQTGANQQMNLGQIQQNMTYADLQALLASGTAQQGQQQAVNDAASANATAKQMSPLQIQQWLAGIAGGVGPLTGGTTTGTGTTSTPKGVGQYVGAGLTAASLLSDRRSKEDVKPIGKTFDGQTVYSYRYKGSPKQQIGLIADEVRKSHPDAVGQHPSGMEMVDYGRATEDAADRGHFASGGSVGFEGLWNDIRPAAPMMPQLAAMPAAAAPQSPSMQEHARLGSSARAGIDGILAKLSPSKGWNAGTTIEPTNGAGMGSLASLGSFLGFAPGGAVDFDGLGDIAYGRRKRPIFEDEFIGEVGPQDAEPPLYMPQGEMAGDPAARKRSIADLFSRGPTAPSDYFPPQGETAGMGYVPSNQPASVPDMPERGSMPSSYPDMPTRGERSDFMAPASGATRSIGDMAALPVGDMEQGSSFAWSPDAAPAPATGGEIRTSGNAPAPRIRALGDAIEMQESGGRDNLVSSAGARGPMQIMPGTARDPGYGIEPMRNINDPAENRRFGREYFNAMLREFKGDEQAALIAYNGGPKRAIEWLEAGRDDSVLPTETSNYYKQVGERLASGASLDTVASEGGSLVARAMSPDAPTKSASYAGTKDKAVGGLLKSLFGIEFNPLKLDENERLALMTAGLSMMSSGDIGGGGLKGLNFLQTTRAAERESAMDERKFGLQQRKDERDAASDAQKLKLDLRRTNLMGAGKWSLSPDGTMLVNDATGQTKPTGAEKAQADTPAMKEYGLAVDQGFKGSFTEFEQERKQANVKGQISGEVAARLGLADGFIAEFPDIRKRVEKGFGGGDRAGSLLDAGELAETQAKIATGMDALVRMNTGAAMPASEEAAYNRRYQINATDKAPRMLMKLDKLKVDLQNAKKGVITGNTGQMVREYNAGQKAAPQLRKPSATELEGARAALARGNSREKVLKRFEELGISAQGL